MNINMEEWGPATVLVIVLVAIIGLVGGVIAIVNPGVLSFSDYADKLLWAAGAVGVLGGARAYHGAQKAHAEVARELGVHVLVGEPGGLDEIEGDVKPSDYPPASDNDDRVASRQGAGA